MTKTLKNCLFLYEMARHFAEMSKLESEDELLRWYNLHLTPADQRVILARIIASVPEMANYIDATKLFCGLPDKFSDDAMVHSSCNSILLVFTARHLITTYSDAPRPYTNCTDDKSVMDLREQLKDSMNKADPEYKEPSLIKYEFTCPHCGGHKLEMVTDARTVRPVDMDTIIECTEKHTFRTMADLSVEPLVDEYDRIGFRCAECGGDDWEDELDLIRLGALTKVEYNEHTSRETC